MINLADLKKPFPVDKVSFRIGSRTQDKSKGIGLAYIDARDVMERLDEVCGPAGWQALYPHANGKTSCKIGIFMSEAGGHPADWIWKENGAGDTDVEGEKGAFSDAFKRAAVLWGIGRYLYDMPNVWVELENDGRKFAPSAMKKLQDALSKLSEGQKPIIHEIKDKANVRMVSEINQLPDPPAAKLWWKKNEADILALPEEQQYEVDEQFRGKLQMLEDGNNKRGPYKFVNVAESNAFGMEFAGKLKDCQTLLDVNNLEFAFKMKLDALLGQKDGKTAKERMADLIQAKRNELKPNPLEAG